MTLDAKLEYPSCVSPDATIHRICCLPGVHRDCLSVAVTPIITPANLRLCEAMPGATNWRQATTERIYDSAPEEMQMRRVTGIGGVFFKAKDPKALGEWYRTHLGMDVKQWGGVAFRWADDNLNGAGTTAWSLFKDDTTHFAPSNSSFMVNYRVEDLDALLVKLREEGCNVDGKVEESEYGKFGWVMDPEGNRLELWQPPQGG